MKHFLLLLFPLAFLSGCGSRVTDWMAEHVEHGNVRTVPKEKVLSYLRTARIYDEFSTVGIFNVLWLSSPVRQAYVDVHAAKYAMSSDKKDDFMCRQRIENDNYISFYVLGYIPGNAPALGNKRCPWNLELKVHDKLYTPKSIEVVELSPEYTMFLRKYLNNYKTIYLVRFAAKDGKGNEILQPRTRMMSLRLSTVDRSTLLTWYFDKNKNLTHKGKGAL